MMIIYVAVVAALIWGFADKFALLFISADETEIIADTALFLHFNVSFFPLLGMLSILRYSIQGAGYTKLAMFSGVSEMIARHCSQRTLVLHRHPFPDSRRDKLPEEY